MNIQKAGTSSCWQSDNKCLIIMIKLHVCSKGIQHIAGYQCLLWSFSYNMQFSNQTVASHRSSDLATVTLQAVGCKSGVG